MFESTARSLEIGLQTVDISSLEQAATNLGTFAHAPNGGLLVLPTPLTTDHRHKLVAGAERHRLPAIYPYSYFVSTEVQVSCGIQGIDLYRRGTEYIAHILEGAKPSEMPIVQPGKLGLVINLKTAWRSTWASFACCSVRRTGLIE